MRRLLVVTQMGIWALVIGACGGKALTGQQCGNGLLEGSEICDGMELGGADCQSEGFAGGILACNADCGGHDTSLCGDFECGNGLVEPGESCDGTNMDGQTCTSLGFDGGPLACNGDCSFDTSGCPQAHCGNGVLDPSEDCDGANLGGATCDSRGWGTGTLGCTGSCLLDPTGCSAGPECGNGAVEYGEACDDANQTSCDGCSASCQLDGCGNGAVDCDEVCDDGNTTAGDGCSADCRSDESCGNGIVDAAAGETCDDGNTAAGDGCSAACGLESCGNGIVDVGEDCDGGGVDTQTCDANCTTASCGDGYVNGNAGETCDDFGESASCDSDCSPAACGDGYVNVTAGEVCDDSNTVDGDGCSASCLSNEGCGNGFVDTLLLETCDDGAANSNLPNAACRTDCRSRRCGDGIRDDLHGEECDGADLGGQTCAGLGHPAGSLACSSQCAYDTTPCGDPCTSAAANGSPFGCEFYAADLPNYSVTDSFAIVVANPSQTRTATVDISAQGTTLTTLTLPPGDQQTYLDSGRAQHLLSTGVSNQTYHITSDEPIAAYQINPWEIALSSSNDGALLLPVHGLGTLYYNMSYEGIGSYSPFIAIYATQPSTTVNVWPAAPVVGSTSNVSLHAGEILVLKATQANTDLTGSRIEADKPIGVFGGTMCANVPHTVSYCSHLEQQIPPRRVWDDHYVIVKSPARSTCDPEDQVRVLADTAGTTVTLDPPVVAPFVLNAGDWSELVISQPVELTATHPVLVGQFLRGGGDSSESCNELGDPAFIVQTPQTRLTAEHVLLLPPSYDEQHLAIVAPMSTVVTLDGGSVTLNSTGVGSSGYSVTHVALSAGGHTVSSAVPIAVYTYGYSGSNRSYGFPTGGTLLTTNPVE